MCVYIYNAIDNSIAGNQTHGRHGRDRHKQANKQYSGEFTCLTPLV